MKSIPLVLVTVCMLTVALAAQSLGEVAKKAEAERKVQKASAKTYTVPSPRMRTSQAALDGDQVFPAAATARERELTRRFGRGENDGLYIRNGLLRAEIDGQREAALAEVSRLKAAVDVDRQAIISLLEEARRANVPPGWLRP